MIYLYFSGACMVDALVTIPFQTKLMEIGRSGLIGLDAQEHVALVLPKEKENATTHRKLPWTFYFLQAVVTRATFSLKWWQNIFKNFRRDRTNSESLGYISKKMFCDLSKYGPRILLSLNFSRHDFACR